MLPVEKFLHRERIRRELTEKLPGIACNQVSSGWFLLPQRLVDYFDKIP